MKRRIGTALGYFIFSLAALFSLFPLFALLLASFKPSTELLQYGLNLKLQPELLTLDNYISIFTEGGNYLSWYKNSLIILVIYTLLSLLLSSLVGYALAVYNFRGKNLIFTLVMLIMIVPIEILLLPLYNLMIKMGLINTYTGVVVPFLVLPLAVFFFRQYASGLPKELVDSARMDGCTEYGIFAKIMAPIMLPAFGAMAILLAMQSWNNFLWPLIVLTTNERFTLPVGIVSLNSPYSTNYEIMLSGSALTILPILIIFFMFQKFFIAGLTGGSVKG